MSLLGWILGWAAAHPVHPLDPPLETTRTRYQIKRKAIERYVSFKLGSTKDGRDTTNIFYHKIYIGFRVYDLGTD